MSEAVPVAAAEMAAAGFSRVALGLEYKGARYRGFQRQAGKVASIQGCLEMCLRDSIWSEGKTRVGTAAMGDAVASALHSL